MVIGAAGGRPYAPAMYWWYWFMWSPWTAVTSCCSVLVICSGVKTAAGGGAEVMGGGGGEEPAAVTGPDSVGAPAVVIGVDVIGVSDTKLVEPGVLPDLLRRL